MAVIFVARSAKLARWGSDVGLGKHLYKVGVAEDDPKPLALAGWAGESDWTIVGRETVEGLSEEAALARIERKEKLVEPRLYPRLKGAAGVFRLNAVRVENHLLVARALAGAAQGREIKLKPADFARYLIESAVR